MQKRAAVIAAFGNLQIRVVVRREFDALGRHEIDQRIVFGLRRQVLMHRLHDRFVLRRAGDRENLRVRLFDGVRRRHRSPYSR